MALHLIKWHRCNNRKLLTDNQSNMIKVKKDKLDLTITKTKQ